MTSPEQASEEQTKEDRPLGPGEGADAVARAGEMVRDAPECAENLYRLAVAQADAGNIGAARAPLERLLTMEPTHHSARALLARCRHGCGDAEGAWQTLAVGCIGRMTENAPPPDALLSAAAVEALHDLGRAAGDVRRLDFALSMCADHIGATLARAALEEPDQRLERLGRLAGRQPGSAAAMRELGRALVAAGRCRDAIGPLRAAAAMAPGDKAVHRDLALALEATQDGDAAFAAWRAVVRLDPDDAQACGAVAIGWHERGDLEAALRHARRWVVLSDGDDAAVALLVRVEQARGGE